MMNPAEFANIAHAEKDFWWYRGMRTIMSRMLDPVVRNRAIRNVLEAGCGTGYNAVTLRERYGWNVVPLDLDREGLRYGKAFGLQRMIQGDVSRLPFPHGVFDALVSMDVIVHFPRGEENRALSEFARVLAPGGLLVLRVSALDVLRSRHSQFAHERQRFTADRLIRAVAAQDFRVLRCTYANTLLAPVAFAKFRLWEPLLRSEPESGVLPVSPVLNRILEAPLAAESRWLGAGFNFPLGQSLILIGERRAA